ncbi:hypothetical protein F5Y04DRAFT_288682 [Hypomontagnella monticulosa]|nr:hypothetical protein F5Y04DRAFT_288682 [Hypomontagnella monticulosa]
MANARPTILIFCWATLDDVMLAPLRGRANVHQASYETVDGPVALLNEHPSARAIWIVDCDIARPEYKDFSDRVVEYARSGGRVILGGLFPINILALELDNWMRDAWGLPWRYGRYEKTTVVFQDSADGPHHLWWSGLVYSYSPKAVFLTDVAPSDSWYASDPESVSESWVLEPVEAQTAVAFGKVGEGWLGWIGDVYNLPESGLAMRAMMGLNVREGD